MPQSRILVQYNLTINNQDLRLSASSIFIPMYCGTVVKSTTLLMCIVIFIVVTLINSVIAAEFSSANVKSSMIGLGYNLPESDLWSLSGLYGATIFNSNFTTEQCIVEQPCSHVMETVNANFTSTNAWYQYFSESNGLYTDSTWMGLDLSVSHSMGQQDAYAWWSERTSTYVATSNVQRCYQINTNSPQCDPYSSLSEAFVSALKALPQDGSDAETMELWGAAFISRFGTHWARQSSHGAMIKVLSSVDAACETSMDCLMEEVRSIIRCSFTSNRC